MFTKNLLILLALLLVSVLASAGCTHSVPVTVDLENMVASGDMRTARNSKNTVEYIGCGVRLSEDSVGEVFAFGFCQARDADENTILCNTSNTELIDALDSVSDSSFLTFSWDDADTCTRIGASTQSFYLKKGKINKVGE